MYDLDSREGQLCLSDIHPNKKYKLAILNEEYLVGDLKAGNFELNKAEVAYESDWFTLKDEPVSPFYRQKTSMLNSLFLINKCWMDLKLYPVGDESMYKQFYFVLSNEQDDTKSVVNNLNCKIITIKPKFVIKNKTKHSLKFKLMNDFMKQTEVNKLLSRYIQPDEYLVNAQDSSYPVDEIIDKKSFYLMDKDPVVTTVVSNNTPPDEEITKEIRKQRDILNDLFYLHLESVDSCLCRQSKPLILTCNERALKQISTQTQSNENFLISRQCFSVYNDQISKENTTRPFILTQKLLTEQNGQLVIVFNEDPAVLVQLHNHMNLDVYVWPRISANFIFENYVKNVKSINERSLNDLIKDEGGKKLKVYSSLTRQSSLSNMMIDTQQALNFMHFVPAGAVFAYNYDFTGKYNLENIFTFFILFQLVNF
jgi:hypothetical protein